MVLYTEEEKEAMTTVERGFFWFNNNSTPDFCRNEKCYTIALMMGHSGSIHYATWTGRKCAACGYEGRGYDANDPP